MKNKVLLFAVLTAMLFPALAGAVTLNVKVPSGTKKCYVTGQFLNWSAESALEMLSSGENTFSLEVTSATQSEIEAGYKYLCGQDWAYVEKSSSGAEIGNRTSISSLDVVGSWASVPDYRTDKLLLTVNSASRRVQVRLPEGYMSSGKRYPVIYYNAVNTRYRDGGGDNSADSFIGAYSWNAGAVLDDLSAEGSDEVIAVQIYSFIPENLLAAEDEFAGGAVADAYLGAIVNDLMPEINSRYPTDTDPANTTIIGADIAAGFSLYAALQRPDVFGKAVCVSPRYLSASDLDLNASVSHSGQRFYLCCGTGEPEGPAATLTEASQLLGSLDGANVSLTILPGGDHTDTDFGEYFSVIAPSLLSKNYVEPVVPASYTAASTPVKSVSAAVTGEYSLVNAIDDSSNLQFDPSVSFTLIDNYTPKGSEPKSAYVLVKDIPTEVKTKYYWNVANSLDGTGDMLFPSPKNIGFSSKKSATSWHRVAVTEGNAVENVAAMSTGFSVVTTAGSVKMAITEGHTVSATVDFSGSDKGFTIHYGSVNSGSDMGSITSDMSVSGDCVEAVISYDFLSNSVSVTETKHGATIDDIAVVRFSAVPAVAMAGDNIAVTLDFGSDPGADVTLTATKDFGTESAIDMSNNGNGIYTCSINGSAAGIYTLSVDVSRGETSKKDVASIDIRVLPAGQRKDMKMSVNTYKDVDWETTGRYKANFHTHTSNSFDTKFHTHEVIDRYYNAGYKVLSITDHDYSTYPWDDAAWFRPEAEPRNAEALGMLSVQGIELSKDWLNTWNETAGSGSYNHHNDFFTGRRGQEFATLRESYAYTAAIGGLQLINHPGQYWSLSNSYKSGAKDSPEWHAYNFQTWSSLIGLEVYNQGNRRPNDRILWDQILDITMPETPVWGYSNDDTHTLEQYFRNYQFMLMPDLSMASLREAMENGRSVFSYEYSGSGEAKAPHIASISVDEAKHVITIDADTDDIVWISSTVMSDPAVPSTRRSAVVGIGSTFDYTGYQGAYVRALLKNEYGETCTQPFGFKDSGTVSVSLVKEDDQAVSVYPNPATDIVNVRSNEPVQRVTLMNMGGMPVRYAEYDGKGGEVTFSVSGLQPGCYVAVIATETSAASCKLIVK